MLTAVPPHLRDEPHHCGIISELYDGVGQRLKKEGSNPRPGGILTPSIVPLWCLDPPPQAKCFFLRISVPCDLT